MRAVLEGVAFGLADSFDLLRALGVETTVARASGGGARSDFWLRICASVLGVPVARMAVDEGSAFGAAMLGGIAGGLFANAGEAIEACVRVRDEIEPEPGWLELYAERRERFRALYPALKSVYVNLTAPCVTSSQATPRRFQARSKLSAWEPPPDVACSGDGRARSRRAAGPDRRRRVLDHGRRRDGAALRGLRHLRDRVRARRRRRRSTSSGPT